MDRLQSRVNSSDAAFKSNHEHNSALLDTLRERLETVQQGGGGKYVEKHRSRGKASLVSESQPFVTQGHHSLNCRHWLHLSCMMERHPVLES